jgi:hypothetical protein
MVLDKNPLPKEYLLAAKIHILAPKFNNSVMDFTTKLKFFHVPQIMTESASELDSKES